ncbi:2ed035e2-ce59-4179-bb30-2397245faa1b [Thermothielavioides terrestris]|uniref:2ed035e2-ce59-4179-bb30-2397245faa1b n=1 Tax=Thermothielavioides terrestris TaxID=2587410 RepID=A0A3S4AV61_9PEZI|nr:2ed035e2-ce59-4179-bb30-2397245faa1b [Thermothielavioides terrestris]
MASESNAPASAAAPAASASASAAATKPVKPDEDAFKKELAKLEKDHKAAMDQYNAIKAKIELAVPDKDKPNPTQQRRQELIAEANEIRKKQAGGKAARTSKLDQVKRLEEQLRSRIAEQKAARAKVPFKSVEEIDQKIAQLDRDVESGKMKLVDEKKALAEASNLRKLRKNFSQFDQSQQAIDDLRAKIKEIKDSLEDPEAKALSDRYTQVQTELDAIKAQQDDAYKNLSALRKERDELRAKQQATYQAIKQLKDQYHTQRKAVQAWQRQQREKQRQREQAERERINKERRMERAKAMLDEASLPAFAEELRRANSLLHHFDPSHAEEKAPLLADKGLAATAQRKVDASAFEGMRALRKEDRDEEYVPAAAKKGKKSKKNHATDAPAAAGKFSCPPSVIEDCTFLELEPPMSAAEVPAFTEKVKAKIAHWKANQAEQTRKNIEKATKEIERLEAAEASAAAGSGASTPTKGANGQEAAPETAITETVQKTAEAPKEVEAAA